MMQLIEVILQLAIPLILLVLGLSVGGINERRHLKDLARREQLLRTIRVTNHRHVPDSQSVTDATLVIGHVVIGTDYFKTFVTSIRNLVGGEMKTAQRLMDRARREALLRAMEQAKTWGAEELQQRAVQLLQHFTNARQTRRNAN